MLIKRAPNSCEFGYEATWPTGISVFVLEVGFARIGVVVRFDLIGLELIGITGQFFVPFLFEVIIEVIIEIIIIKIIEWISGHRSPPCRVCGSFMVVLEGRPNPTRDLSHNLMQ
jgi:hypothetical protein